MSLTITTTRVRKGEYVATLGEMTEFAATAAEAKAALTTRVLRALEWHTPVVVTTPEVVLVAYAHHGSYGYDVFDAKTGARRVSTGTGETFTEAVEAMRRHAQQYEADETSSRPIGVVVTENTGTFAVIEVAHPALRDVHPICPDCLALADAAIGTAAATGSVGATYTVNKVGSTEVDHSITVRRQLAVASL